MMTIYFLFTLLVLLVIKIFFRGWGRGQGEDLNVCCPCLQLETSHQEVKITSSKLNELLSDHNEAFQVKC